MHLRLTQIIAGICTGFLFISAIAVTASYFGYRETGKIQQTWSSYEKGPSRKSALLNDLRGEIGFGGMIHQFKNYVIRRDEARLTKIDSRIQNAKRVIKDYERLNLSIEEQKALEIISENITTYESAATIAKQMVSEGQSISAVDNAIRINDNPALAAMKTLDENLSIARDASTNAISRTVDSLHQQLALSAVIGLVIASICSIFALFALRGLYKQLGTEPSDLRNVAEAIANGDLDVDLNNNDQPSQGVLLAMETMRDKLREQIESDRRIAAESSRIKQALETCSGNLMIADADGTIIYMNNAIKEMMQRLEPSIREALPSFNADQLIGSSIDQFHKNPAHQQNILENLKETYVVEVPIGCLHMRIVVNPVWGKNKERQGTVAEWIDRTQEVATEEEIQHIVNSAKSGDLSQRIVLKGKHGFFERLSGEVNEMVDVSERVIKDTAGAVSAMSKGDLTQNIQSDYSGSFGQLKDDVNSTIAKLTTVMGEITSAAHSVLNGSRELSLGNNNLSQRTEQQASNLEETASSMEQMIATVRQNADNAQSANNLAISAREQAEKGGNVVNKAVSAMSEITDSSNKIAAIIGVIDEIAFQTNLLALNAAVEAARAGEQGRGFAVVASEVRNLAGRSATAANEIKELIEDSVKKVDEGSKLVDASGQTLVQIVDSIKTVSDIIADIALASQEQSEGIDQVNRAIAEIDEVTQQNAALVQQAATASESMGEQASNLNDLVGFFKTGNNPASNAVTDLAERRKADRPWTEQQTETEKPVQEPEDEIKSEPMTDDSEWAAF